jgi:short-subunit dehydrogenase involved in D-alanine esterification of teichoic acids
MSQADNTVYLISGANRGIGTQLLIIYCLCSTKGVYWILGFGLVKALVKRNSTIVFAGVRDLTRATELEALAKESSGKLYIVKLISADEVSNTAAIEEIKAKTGRLDVVIANAGNT